MATTITCVTGQGAAEVHPIEAFLPAPLRESARGEANGWIKRLRLVRYGGRAMRERFRYRDDSLWWFTELYLHKMRQLDLAVSTVLALDAARDRLSPTRVSIDTTSSVAREAAIAFGRARGLPVEVTGRLRTSNPERFSYLTALTARLSRLRPGGARRIWSGPRPDVAAFIHTAFWKISDGADGPDQESYIGPVLTAVGARLAPGRLACVGVGPRREHRAPGSDGSWRGLASVPWPARRPARVAGPSLGWPRRQRGR